MTEGRNVFIKVGTTKAHNVYSMMSLANAKSCQCCNTVSLTTIFSFVLSTFILLVLCTMVRTTYLWWLRLYS
jgi:hypothetical protein